ncbi:MAG: NTP transferase domain-containing protein [Ilumatobacter sp.]|uniref:phosphocholine cytidylyltransferase family protein n=1 Tax=Ilumatobacter sp. TaxID=1967498 RepID=UPI00391A8A11
MRIIILAAGVGSRLGRPIPKPLTQLADGYTILERQIRMLQAHFDGVQIVVVVGFKKDMIMEAHPNVLFAYNERFGETNTSKSLLRALSQTGDDDVLWMNGDVVFDASLLEAISRARTRSMSFVAVNHASVGDEEVKYRLGESGSICELSKLVVGGEGEAVGVNYVTATDKPSLIQRLDECADDDYFERGIELSIDVDGTQWVPVDVAGLCIEVDFESDLADVNRRLEQHD